MNKLDQYDYGKIFSKAAKISSTKDLEKLINENPFLQISIEDFIVKYPETNLSLTRKEIEEAIQDNVLSTEHLIKLNGGRSFTTLEQLLILWYGKTVISTGFSHRRWHNGRN